MFELQRQKNLIVTLIESFRLREKIKLEKR